MATPDEITLRAAYKAVDDAGLLVADLTKTQHRELADIVAEALYYGWTDARTAKKVEQVIGLNKRQQAAVRNHRALMVKQGKTSHQADVSATAYAKRLRQQRAKAVTGHERRTQLGEATRQQWAQDQHDGKLSPYAVRVFKTHKDERTCKVCAPMNGKRQSLTSTANVPPLHPGCRCTEVLLDEGVVKARHVRTIEGTKRFKLPIGAPIPEGKPKFKHRKASDVTGAKRLSPEVFAKHIDSRSLASGETDLTTNVTARSTYTIPMSQRSRTKALAQRDLRRRMRAQKNFADDMTGMAIADTDYFADNPITDLGRTGDEINRCAKDARDGKPLHENDRKMLLGVYAAHGGVDTEASVAIWVVETQADYEQAVDRMSKQFLFLRNIGFFDQEAEKNWGDLGIPSSKDHWPGQERFDGSENFDSIVAQYEHGELNADDATQRLGDLIFDLHNASRTAAAYITSWEGGNQRHGRYQPEKVPYEKLFRARNGINTNYVEAYGDWGDKIAYDVLPDDISDKQLVAEAYTAAFARSVVDQWADTTGDHRTRAYMTQIAVSEWSKKRFGVKAGNMEHHANKRAYLDAINAMDDTKQKGYSQLLDAMYDETQAEFKARKIDAVKLHRGMKFDQAPDWIPNPPRWDQAVDIEVAKLTAEHPDATPQALQAQAIANVGDHAQYTVDHNMSAVVDGEIDFNAATSWAAEFDTAERFATGGYNEVGITFTADVPVENILSLSTTGLGALHENEVAVIGYTMDRVKITATTTFSGMHS